MYGLALCLPVWGNHKSCPYLARSQRTSSFGFWLTQARGNEGGWNTRGRDSLWSYTGKGISSAIPNGEYSRFSFSPEVEPPGKMVRPLVGLKFATRGCDCF